MKNIKLKKDLLESLRGPEAGSSDVLNLFSDGGVSGFSVHSESNYCWRSQY